MYKQIRNARDFAQRNPYMFCRDFIELSSKEMQKKLLEFIFKLDDAWSFKIWHFKTNQEVIDFRKDCIDVMSDQGIVTIDNLFLNSFDYNNHIFIDYENEEIRELNEYFTIIDYLDDIEIFDNLEVEEKDEIFFFIAKNYEL